VSRRRPPDVTSRPPTLRRALARDLRAGLAASAGGALGLGLVEWVATMRAHTGPIAVSGAARLLLLDATLIALMWVALLPLCAVAAVTPRLVRALVAGRTDAAAAPSRLVAPSRWPDAAAPMLLAGGAALVGYGIAVTWIGARMFVRFKEPVLLALLLSVVALLALAGTWLVARVGGALLDRARAALARLWPRGTRWTPLGSPWQAITIGCVLVAIALLTTGRFHPHLRPVWPWRRLLSLIAFLAGAGIQLELAARWPAGRRRRVVGLAAALPALVLVPLTLVRCGGDPEVKYVAVTASPTLATAIELVRKANDLDGDGFGSLLGENDCAPRTKSVRPGARDLPDNGIDENCDGRDFSMRDLVVPSGPAMPVPPGFRRPWNVLFITIDTVRYDHTSFGGRKTGPKQRDTTPRLAELVSRATSFNFAQAPSAGTMASIPAIITSKFFHSGIGLDEKKIKPGMPPRLKKDNTTIAEIMKRGGYATGAILSHEYFNDWGMEQGFDEYDNEIGKTHDPNRVSANRVTDRALAWIARRPHGKWFLWTHYLDPHAQYVSHPGETSFGDSPEDLYDGELHFTDKQIGRLLDELIRLPGGDRTIVVITSDHGDAFGEHGFFGHAIALAREVIHVPLVIYIPDNLPREVGGAVSNLDALPTVADLCGIDVSDLSFEGKSLVPQIFYGKEEPDRAVFSETNYPNPLRAAVTTRWKLIYNMKGNFHELYDLTKDPLEKANVASREKEGMALMKPILDAWLERVVFARDPSVSQAAMRMGKVLLAAAPTPAHPVTGVTLDDGAIEVLGFDTPTISPGGKPAVVVYMRAVRRPTRALKFGVVLWGVTDDQQGAAPLGGEQGRSLLRVTLDGLLPSDRWRPGEMIREELEVVMPTVWTRPFAAVGLVASGPDGAAGWSAPHPGADSSIGYLGVVPVVGATPAPTPPTPASPAPAGPLPPRPTLPPIKLPKPPEPAGSPTR
jgi:arylsulfatase A-like enzyme